MNKKKLISLIVVVFVVVIAISVILMLTQQEPSEKVPIKIGAILPLTGRAAMLGENVRNGMQMAADDINNAGGINGRMVEIEFGDSKDDPKEGVSLMNRYTSINKIPVVVSAMTAITAPLIPIAERTNTVLFSSMVSSPNFAEKSEFLFRCFTRASNEIPTLTKIAFDNLNLRNIAIFYIDDDFGKGYSEKFKNEFEKLGGTIIDEMPFPRGGTDFRNSIVKLKSDEIDGIYFVGYSSEMGIIPKQIREMGIEKQLLANASMATPTYINIAGEAAEGIVLMNFAFSTRSPGSESGLELVQRYEEKFGSTPLTLTVIGYDIVGLIIQALKQEGYSGDAIQKGLLGIRDYEGVIGKLAVQPDGEVDIPLVPYIIKEGRSVPFLKEKE